MRVGKFTISLSCTSSSGEAERKRERAYQEVYARRYGYYWLPCDLCGECFGGHEASGSLPISEEQLRHICPSCTAERQVAAERRLREVGASTRLITSRWGRVGPAVEHAIPDRARP